MRVLARYLPLVALIGYLAVPLSSQDIGPTGPIPYDIVDNWAKPFAAEGFAFGGNSGAVSYTHLTLPTILRV